MGVWYSRGMVDEGGDAWPPKGRALERGPGRDVIFGVAISSWPIPSSLVALGASLGSLEMPDRILDLALVGDSIDISPNSPILFQSSSAGFI